MFTNNGSLEKGLMMRAEPTVLQELYTTVLEHATPVELLPCPVSASVSASSVILKQSAKSYNIRKPSKSNVLYLRSP